MFMVCTVLKTFNTLLPAVVTRSKAWESMGRRDEEENNRR